MFVRRSCHPSLFARTNTNDSIESIELSVEQFGRRIMYPCFLSLPSSKIMLLLTLSEKKDLVELVVRENGGGVETHAGSFGQRASRPSG